jgi:hypothetical protein
MNCSRHGCSSFFPEQKDDGEMKQIEALGEKHRDADEAFQPQAILHRLR